MLAVFMLNRVNANSQDFDLWHGMCSRIAIGENIERLGQLSNLSFIILLLAVQSEVFGLLIGATKGSSNLGLRRRQLG